VLRADLVMGVGKQADELVSVGGWLNGQNYMESLPIGAIDDRSPFGEAREALSAVSALVSVSVQRGVPLLLGRWQRV
ncbi:MAG: hypothetical protein WAR24_06535, partial [Candidatus Acidiferrales bacterium]